MIDVLAIQSSANIDQDYNYYGSTYYHVSCEGSNNHGQMDIYTEYSYRNNNSSDKVYAYNPSWRRNN